MKLVYRADGGHPVGTGHLFRAQRVLSELAGLTKLDARLLVGPNPDGLRLAERVPARKITICDAREPSAIKPVLDASPIIEELSRESADLIVVDMLDTPMNAMEALSATGVPIVTLDDRGPGRVCARAVINVLIEEPDPERLPPSLRLFEGGKFVTLGAEFSNLSAGPDRQFDRANRVFVSMGGADAAGLTVKVARALIGLPIDLVEFGIGPAFPFRLELQATLASANWSWTLLEGLPNLIGPYQRSDLSIIAGGLTMYEVCCAGAPALAVCQPIDHQFELANRLAAARAMATAGYGLEMSIEDIRNEIDRLLKNADERRKMSAVGPTVVDGMGTSRVARLLLELAKGTR